MEYVDCTLWNMWTLYAIICGLSWNDTWIVFYGIDLTCGLWYDSYQWTYNPHIKFHKNGMSYVIVWIIMQTYYVDYMLWNVWVIMVLSSMEEFTDVYSICFLDIMELNGHYNYNPWRCYCVNYGICVLF